MKNLKVNKGQIIQHRGELGTKVYTVVKGLLRSYAIDAKGKEHTYLFAPEGWIIADSKRASVPSELFIEALEDSELKVMPKIFDEDMDIGIEEYEKITRRMEVLQDRIIMLMSATALERYEHFMETYPNIIQRVPQRMVASYLGITPEALSKVKRDLQKK
ncbi:Crp/Fnr family transcriptional regulator [Sediminitomix flava]|uniref:CRP-like cAMP-binding protein n=1 Tax=Sediminitomix flava TaxID=379075 RepID=A0A315ZIT8_SEDFL|nr:Crp/Fnr family transcriptional regulator [Sediminitomix flava]PWJ44614.1 CRP-like cAMP-binding protein [Sediminitomix flava]